MSEQDLQTLRDVLTQLRHVWPELLIFVVVIFVFLWLWTSRATRQR